MENEVFPKTVKQNYCVCAIVFGADETICDIKLRDGFRFVKKSIYSKEDNLTAVFQTDITGLQREYINAFIDKQDFNFGTLICIYKENTVELNVKAVPNYWHEQNQKDIQSIDNQLRIIRLVKEGPIRVKRIAFDLHSESYGPINMDLSYGQQSILQVNESFTTKNISKISCTQKDLGLINNAINNISLPFADSVLNIAHIYYDLSYHTELYIAVTLLITALEIVFLKKGDSKKEPLSKRCAAYIGTTDEEINRYYQCLKDSYEKRRDFVHEGNALFITENIVLFLRECVRKSILKAIDSTETKTERIKRLKEFVGNNQKLFGG